MGEDSGCTETQLRLFNNVKAAGYRDTPLLERDWTLVQNLEHSQGNAEVSATFETFATAIVGDENTRRAPASIAIPTRRARPNRPSLQCMANTSGTKIKMVTAF